MFKLIGVALQIVLTIIKGVARQNEAERKKREELSNEAKKAWTGSGTGRAVDRMWSRLRR